MTLIKSDGSRAPSAFLCAVLAALMTLTLIPVSVLSQTKQAYAAVDIPSIGDTFYGDCYIENEWRVGDTTHFNVSKFSGELAGCKNVDNYYCADPSAAAPSYVWSTYVARVVAVDLDAGYVEYYVYITPPGATDGVSRDPATGWLYGYQHVAANVRVAKDFGGFIELYKTSANTSVSQGNSCYSFEGGVFNVYSEGGAHVATLTTNKDGYAKTTDRLKFGWYNVVEVKAPKGYALDTSDHWVQITSANSGAATVRVADLPQGNPIQVAVKKLDADTLTSKPQGDTTLAGANFKIDYYAGYYKTEAEAMASGTPARTWTVKSDEKGEAYLSESYLLSGSSALYRNSQGEVIIPLGTVVIKETKAPADYLLPVPVPVEVMQVTSNSKVETVTTYNAPKIADKVKRGDIAITKAYDDTPEEDTGTMVPEANIVFDFFGSHQFVGESPISGVKPAFSLTTNEYGRADTSKMYIIKNADGTYSERPRTSDDAGALPHDTYLMVQRTTIEGYEKLDPMIIYVSENGKTYDYLLQNGTIQTPLKVVKVDSETGEVVPYPASWQIIDCVTGKPVSMTTYYPAVETFDVFTSDPQGRLTLPEKLPWGEYELKEVLAPADEGTGYLLNPVNVKFKTEDGYNWDNPLTVTFADAPAKGRIEIVKTDAYTGEPVEKATYVVQAVGDIYTLDGTLRVSDGEIVTTITTDEMGYAATDELYLGRYDVIEAISPEGFALDTKRWGITLEYADQTVPVVTEVLEVSDTPTTLEIEKIDSLTGEPMAEVEFRVVADEGEYDQTVITGDDGRAQLSYIPHGSYTVTEIATPFGYVASDESYQFVVDDQGLVEGGAVYSITIENTPIQVKVSKIDIASTEELPGCEMEIYLADEAGEATGEPLYAWTTTSQPYEIIGGFEPGSYILRETLAATGYVITDDILFEVANTGEIQLIVMEDDFTKVNVSKRDSSTDKELPGAHLVVYTADENGARSGDPLYEWVTGDEPFLLNRLEPGDYALVENSAPVGYELAEDITFAVKETSEVQIVVMYDKPTPETPDAGKGYDKTGFDPTPLMVLAVLLAAGGMLGLGIGLKRHYRRTHPQEEKEMIIPRGEDISGDDDLFQD